MKYRRCSKCKRKLSLNKFHKNKNRKSGYCYYCKLCVKKISRKRMNNSLSQTRRRAMSLKSHNKQHSTLIGYLRHVFHGMRTQCVNPNSNRYEFYGALGIKCLFKNADEFINHVIVDLKYSTLKKLKGLVLSRIDPFGHFIHNNIHFITPSEKAWGQRKHKNTSSRYKGVSYRKDRGKWVAYIRFGGRKRHLGTFEKASDAAKAYDRAAIEHFGEFAVTNEMLGLL